MIVILKADELIKGEVLIEKVRKASLVIQYTSKEDVLNILKDRATGFQGEISLLDLLDFVKTNYSVECSECNNKLKLKEIK